MFEQSNKTRNSRQNVLPNFKVFEKIKQVSSTKLTNWYKNISRWKTNESFSSTYFSRCEPKSLKNIALEPQSIFSKNEKLFIWKKLTKSKTPGLNFSSKRDLVFPPTLSQKKSPKPELRLCSKKTQKPKETFEYT